MFQLLKKKIKSINFLKHKEYLFEKATYSQSLISSHIYFFWCIYYFFEPKPKSNLFFKTGIILVQKFQMPKKKQK